MVRYALLLMLANLLWAGSYSAMKWGVADIPPLSLVFYRMGVAAILLWIGVAIFYRHQLKGLTGRFFLRVALVTAFDLIHQTGLCIGVKYSHAIDASLIISMEPVFLFFLATFILDEVLTIRHIMALVLALAGFVALSNFTSIGLDSFGNIVLIGNLIILVAVITETGFSICFKPLARDYSPVLLMAFVTAIQTVVLAPLSYAFDSEVFHPEITYKLVAVIVYLAVFCTIVGYIIWLRAMSKMAVNVMALSLFLQPVFGPVIAALALDEELGPRIFIGGGLILLSLYIALAREVRFPKTRSYPSQKGA